MAGIVYFSIRGHLPRKCGNRLRQISPLNGSPGSRLGCYCSDFRV